MSGVERNCLGMWLKYGDKAATLNQMRKSRPASRSDCFTTCNSERTCLPTTPLSYM